MKFQLIEFLIVLFALATPVQFWIGKSFYIQAYKALKHKRANMDTLVVMGTSAAYFYSVLSMILGNFAEISKNFLNFFF